jgi:hypothetical protein
LAKFKGRRGDLKWGVYDFPVTRTQKAALDGIWYMLRTLPRAYNPVAEDGELPQGGFYSQRENNGDIVIGLHGNSLTVHRSGRITSNEESRLS